MTTALTKAQNNTLANTSFANPFAAAGQGAMGATTYIKFSGASGDFTYGQDEEELPHGTQLAADVENSQWIWTFWWEGNALETVNYMVAENPKGVEQEPDFLPEKYDGDMSLEEIREAQADRAQNFRDGWSCQASLGMREIGGEGTEYTIRLNGGVAVNAFKTLLLSFGRQYKFKDGQLPVVELSARSYKSKVKGVGKRWAPLLKIVDWKTEEELQEAVGDDPADYDDVDDTPPKRTQTASKPREEEVDNDEGDEQEEAPVARGRRGARPQY